jgi:hypothetical protein
MVSLAEGLSMRVFRDKLVIGRACRVSDDVGWARWASMIRSLTPVD